jgi:hypothetical protein
MPDSYAPPIERKPLSSTDTHLIGRFVNMDDANATGYFMKDIAPHLEGTWRWTGQRPELRFFLQSVEGLSFKFDYSIPETTFQTTGPVTLSVFVNDQLLDKSRIEKAGEQHFVKAVPSEWLYKDSLNLVAIETDKVWVSPTDGARLGFVLTRAGFVP